VGDQGVRRLAPRLAHRRPAAAGGRQTRARRRPSVLAGAGAQRRGRASLVRPPSRELGLRARRARRRRRHGRRVAVALEATAGVRGGPAGRARRRQRLRVDDRRNGVVRDGGRLAAAGPLPHSRHPRSGRLGRRVLRAPRFRARRGRAPGAVGRGPGDDRPHVRRGVRVGVVRVAPHSSHPAPDGHSWPYDALVGWAAFALGVVGLWATLAAARLLASPGAALLATVGVWLAGAAVYYTHVNPMQGHVAGFAASALLLLTWLRARARPDPSLWRLAALGLLGGLVALSRWEDGLLL